MNASLKRLASAVQLRPWPLCFWWDWQLCPRRVYAGARKTLEIVLTHRPRSFGANDLESFECVPFRIQGVGSHPTVQGDSQVGRVPGGSVLAVVPTYGAVSADRPFPKK